jgi:hypothetical protein
MKRWHLALPQQPDEKQKQKWHLWQPEGALGVKDPPHPSLAVSFGGPLLRLIPTRVSFLKANLSKNKSK